MRTIASLFILIFLSCEIAHAECTSPAGVAGQMQWIAGESKVKICDGTSWANTYESGGPGCGTAGQIQYSAGNLTYCNGSTRVVMNGGSSLGGCSEPGKIMWDSGRLKVCSGSDWQSLASLVPTYIGQTSGGLVGSPPSATTCRTTKPSGLQEGDLMLIAIYQDGGTSGFTPPSGFTQIGSTVMTGGYYLFKFYKIATSTDVSETYFTFSRAAGMGYECGLMLLHIRNVDGANPIQAFDINTGTSATVSYDSLTSVNANTMSVVIGESMGSTPTNPTGYTNLYSYPSFLTRFSAKIMGTPGASGAATASISSSAWAGTHILINPAP